MNNRHRKVGRVQPIATGLLALLYVVPVVVHATPPFGFTSQTFRGQVTANVQASQWDPSPLFTLLIQGSTTSEWGFDVVPGTTEFAPMDLMGRPSQSGWHDHPTALTIGVVVQGTLWAQEKPNLNCLVVHPTGAVFF